jgi:tetratricopeptide (TPR) repeat protein
MSIGSNFQKGNCIAANVNGNVDFKNCSGDKESQEWKDRYLALEGRLERAGVSDGLRHRVEILLKAGKLDEAGTVLDEVLDSDEKEINLVAQDHFDRATVYQLQYKPVEAMSHFEKAYQYRPDNAIYGASYAGALLMNFEVPKAIPIYEKALASSREEAKKGKQVNSPDVAGILNDLGVAYKDKGMWQQAMMR